ncbi:MAG: hypothetical protein WAV47_26180 [Blastocatellia bacterium]
MKLNRLGSGHDRDVTTFRLRLLLCRRAPSSEMIPRQFSGYADRSSRGPSPSAERAAEPREEMAARTGPRAKPIGREGGGAAGGDGRTHLPEGKAHRQRGRRSRWTKRCRLRGAAFPRAKPIGIAGGGAAGGDGRAHLPEGKAHRQRGRRSRWTKRCRLPEGKAHRHSRAA